ncbi:MAG TPA: helix-turn-helix domain-containing protein, partial [Nitrospirales bacterium]|nr:helix-turn-helix domain-containing protein [Nitrospirales bacterium]
VIAKSLLQKFSDEAKKKITGFSKEATLALEQYPWPGNVRELENRVRRAVTLTDNARIIPEDLDLAEPQEINGSPTLKAARDAVEKKVIEQALAKTGGNITKAATLLEISRPTLHDLITRHHIKK